MNEKEAVLDLFGEQRPKTEYGQTPSKDYGWRLVQNIKTKKTKGDESKRVDSIDAYQVQTERTAGGGTLFREDLTIAALGLTGEAGEVADYIKKFIGHGHNLERGRLILELGDVAWYLARICTLIGVSCSEVLEANIRKLQARYPDGFDPERSRNRAPEAAE